MITPQGCWTVLAAVCLLLSATTGNDELIGAAIVCAILSLKRPA